MVVFLGCSGGVDKAAVVDDTSGEPETEPAPDSLQGHAAECAAELGPPPAWNILEDSLQVPITVDGVEVDGPQWSTSLRCDRPDLLNRSCVPHSRIGWKRGSREDGSEDPDVDWVITFRREDPSDGAELGRYFDVAMIGHRASTGATCFFQAFPTGVVQRIPSPLEDDAAAAGTEVEPTASAFWNSPTSTAGIDCVRCHGADPWVHSPWIDQLRHPDHVERPYVPSGADPDRPYWVVGTVFADWNDQLRHVVPEDNGCVDCHRIGLKESCERLVAYATGDVGGLPLSEAGDAFPMSHWMPPAHGLDEAAWQAEWQADVDALIACCRGPEAATCGEQAVPR